MKSILGQQSQTRRIPADEVGAKLNNATRTHFIALSWLPEVHTKMPRAKRPQKRKQIECNAGTDQGYAEGKSATAGKLDRFTKANLRKPTRTG